MNNFGKIEAGNIGGIGVFIDSGSVSNGSSSDTSALISGAATGLATSGYATASNFGTVKSGGLGVRWAGGVLTNGQAGVDTFAEIVGDYGASITGGPTKLKNFGVIRGTSGGAVYIGGLGKGVSVSLTNGASNDTTALIMGESYGVSVNSAAATVTNYGTIAGTGGTALTFNSASDVLIVEGGSSFVGVVQGGGGTLELASGKGTIRSLGTSFSGFGDYLVQDGGSWTLTGPNTLAAGTTLTNRGTMSIGGVLSESGVFSNLGSVSGSASGVAVQLTGGSLTNGGTIMGGAGSSGGAGGTGVQLAGGYLSDTGAIIGGGGGAYAGAAAAGAGGTAVQMMAGYFTLRGVVTGGTGGGGGSNGVGAAGGAGVYLASGGVLTIRNTGLIEGGAGGGGGTGGMGGTGVQLAGGYLANSGVILGGVGGLGSVTGAGGAGAYVSGGGQLINNGQIEGGAEGGKGTVAAGIVVSGAGTVDNFGTISGGAYAVDVLGSRGVLKVEAGSVLIGIALGGGGTLEVASGRGTMSNLGAIGTISGSASMSFRDVGTYQIDTGVSFTLAGTNTVAAGVTLCVNGNVQSTGAMSVSGMVGGAGGLTITGGGTATIGAGAAVTVATLELDDGTTFLNESLTYQGAFNESRGASLTLGSKDQLTLTGPFQIRGLIDGSGTLSVANGTVGGCTIGGTDVLIATGDVTQDGAVDIGAGNGAGSALEIAKGATWTIGSGIVTLRGAPNASIDIDGTYIGDCTPKSSSIPVAATVGATGVIEAAIGTLTFSGALTGTGQLRIDSDATFQVRSTVASTLTAVFDGPDATLSLRPSASSFAATIAGFAASDAIDLVNAAATGASVNGSDQLVIVNGTKTVTTLQLTGDYNGKTFTTTPDGAGGTDVSLVGSPVQSPHAFVAAMAGFGSSAAHVGLVAPEPANAFHLTLLVKDV